MLVDFSFKQFQCKGVLAENLSDNNKNILMLVNRIDTTFEYAAIFVCWVILRLSQQHK